MFREGIEMAPILLSVVSTCSRNDFSTGRKLRVVDHCSTAPFIPYNEISRHQISQCSELNTIASAKVELYLSEYAGVPGLVKGVEWGHGMKAFSENLKTYVEVPETRTAGAKIKFLRGSTEYSQERSDCWQFCVKRVRANVITPFIEGEKLNHPFVLSRSDDKTCPVCMDDLSGNVVKCSSGHQTCLPCFNLLHSEHSGIKKCPLCNIPNYTIFEYNLVKKMNGEPVEKSPYFSNDLEGGNSHKQHIHNEGLFMGMVKYCSSASGLDLLQGMLLSAFYNHYLEHPDAFTKDYSLMHHSEINSRRFCPEIDDLTEPMTDFLQIANTPAIYNDVSYTKHYMHNYDEGDFKQDLEAIEGCKVQAWDRLKDYSGLERKAILHREIYYRTQIGKMSIEELHSFFRGIFKTIVNTHTRWGMLFNRIKLLVPTS